MHRVLRVEPSIWSIQEKQTCKNKLQLQLISELWLFIHFSYFQSNLHPVLHYLHSFLVLSIVACVHLTIIISLLLSQPHKQVNKLNVLSHFQTSECLFDLRPTLKPSDELLYYYYFFKADKQIYL